MGNIMGTIRTLSPQESRVMLALAKQKRREVGRPEIIKLLGVSEDVILAMMGAFEQEFNGIRFHIPDGSYYETVDGLSWGVNPTYAP